MRRPAFIYVVEAQNGVLKIGSSAVPHERAATINQHSPVPCRLVAMWPGDSGDESALHKQLAPYRSHCEWFRIEGPVAEFLECARGTGLVEIRPWSSPATHAAAAAQGQLKRAAVRKARSLRPVIALTGAAS